MVHVPMIIQQKRVHVPTIIQQDKIIQQMAETTVEVSVPITQEEIVHDPTIIQQERIIQQMVEQILEVPVPMTQEEVIHVPTIIQQEKIIQQTGEMVTEVPVPMIQEEIVQDHPAGAQQHVESWRCRSHDPGVSISRSAAPSRSPQQQAVVLRDWLIAATKTKGAGSRALPASTPTSASSEAAEPTKLGSKPPLKWRPSLKGRTHL
jgi:hypothetical protein